MSKIISKIKNVWQFLAWLIKDHPKKFFAILIIIIGSTIMILMFSCDDKGPKMESKIKVEKTL